MTDSTASGARPSCRSSRNTTSEICRVLTSQLAMAIGRSPRRSTGRPPGTTMRHLELTENAPATIVELSDDEAEALASAELAVVSKSPRSSAWEVAAGRKVGVARIGDLQVVVRPKIHV